MKLVKILFVVAIAAFVSACSTDDTPAVSLQGTEVQATQGEVMSFEGDLTLPPVINADGTPDTRLSISDDDAAKFGWAEKMTMDVYVLFRKGAAVGGQIAMQKGTLTIGTIQADGSWKYKMTVPTPAGFNPNQEDIYASGVIGGVMDASGNVAIAPPTTITNANPIQYQIPMYFPMQKIEKWNFIQANFQMFGSLIALKLSVDLFNGYSPTQLQITSDAFRLGGTMNVNTDATSGIGLPATWNPGTSPTDNTITLSGFNLPASITPKYVYVWMKPQPSTATVTNATTVTVRDNFYKNDVK